MGSNLTGSSNPPLVPKDLLGDIRKLIEETRSAVARAVNTGLTILYWRIGKRINEEILKDNRADYGKQILATLSQELSWSHFKEILPLEDPLQREFYAAFCSARNHLRDKEHDQNIPVGGDAHGYVRKQFKTSKDKVRREIGEDLARLVAKRNLADYDDTIEHLEGETHLGLNWSQEVLSDLSRL